MNGTTRRTPRPPLASRLAPWITLIVVAVSLALWVLRPDRAFAWLVSGLALPAGWGLLALVTGRRKPDPGDGTESSGSAEAHEIRVALTLSGLILLAPLGFKLAAELGWISRAASIVGSSRAAGVVTGLMLAALANVIPRKLTPLAKLRRDPAAQEACQRFVGRVFVLAGLSFASVWLLAPIEKANLAAASILVSALALVLLRRRTRTPSTGGGPGPSLQTRA